MALQVNMIVQASLPDGTIIANVIRGRQTFNPQSNDMRAERDLAVSTAESLTGDALRDFSQSLADWAEAIQRIVDANAEEQPSG